MADRYFTQATFEFLDELARNNNRDWFQENKMRYEECVRTPALNFISAMQAELPLLSPHFRALPKKVGGSLMRVYRDTRFGRDKTPYKTNIGIHFRHDMGKDVHAPGYYLHIANDECFIGAGIWRPDSDALGQIRDAIVERPQPWIAARDHPPFTHNYKLGGESLKRPPRGYSKEHPLLEDLKRKDFIAIGHLAKKVVLSTKLRQAVVQHYSDATPYMRFLCQALSLRFD